MNLVKKHTVPFLENAKLVSERDFEICIGRIFENDIFHVYFFSGAFVDMDFISKVYEFNKENGHKDYLNLFEIQQTGKAN